MRFRHLLPLAALAAWVGVAPSAEAQISATDTFNFRVGTTPPSTPYWSGEHGDIDIHEHDPINNPGDWEVHYHFHDEEFINSGLGAAQRVRAAGSQWDFTGVASGATFYVLPASDTPGLPFLGFSAEDYTFDITYSLDSVTGGVISAWTQDGSGEPTAYWSSSTPGANVGYTVPAGGHEHMFIGFSQVGDYTAQITAVPEPGSLGLAGVAGLGLAAFAWTRRRRG